MFKRPEKQDKDVRAPAAKTRGEPFDVEDGFGKALKRFSRVIARLGK
jgi:hypothetical protein